MLDEYDESRRTAVEVDEEHPLQMFVVDQGGVGTGAGLVVDGEVAHVGVPPEQVVFLLVDDQFLCGHVHVNASQSEHKLGDPYPTPTPIYK